jgi:hypothetical protein
MAINVISQIQHRRGIRSDLPDQLAEGELGWCLDTRQLFMGNSDGFGYNTEVLTEFSQATVPFFGATANTVSAGSTVYLGAIGVDLTNSSTASGFLLPVSGMLKNVTVKSTLAPGAGLNYAYTVYRNGSATSISGNITGTGDNVYVTGNLVVSQGDVVCLQLQTDVASAASQHVYSFVLKH